MRGMAQPASNLLVGYRTTNSPSILFSRKPSGKLTAALETARILSCLAGVPNGRVPAHHVKSTEFLYTPISCLPDRRIVFRKSAQPRRLFSGMDRRRPGFFLSGLSGNSCSVSTRQCMRAMKHGMHGPFHRWEHCRGSGDLNC